MFLYLHINFIFIKIISLRPIITPIILHVLNFHVEVIVLYLNLNSHLCIYVYSYVYTYIYPALLISQYLLIEIHCMCTL